MVFLILEGFNILEGGGEEWWLREFVDIKFCWNKLMMVCFVVDG